MNFYVDANSNLDVVDVYIHPSKIIVTIREERKLYEHAQYQKVIDELEVHFSSKRLEYIREFVKANLENIGVKVDFALDFPKKAEDIQYKLF